MQMPSFFRSHSLHFPATYPKFLGIALLLVIVAAIPLTVYIAQQNQDIRQHAEGGCTSDEDCGSGSYCDKHNSSDGTGSCKTDPDPSGSRTKSQKNNSKSGKTKKKNKNATPTIPEITRPLTSAPAQTGPAGIHISPTNIPLPTLTPRPSNALSPTNPLLSATPRITPTITANQNNGSNSANITLAMQIEIYPQNIGGTAANDYQAPRDFQKAVTLTFFDKDGNKALEKVTSMVRTANTSDITTKGFFPYDTNPLIILPTGEYTLKVTSSGYLTKKAIDSLSVSSTTTRNYLWPHVIPLTPGDINKDNEINLLDYNILMSCFGDKATSATCGSSKTLSDLNNDGVVDGLDYNILIRNFGQKGD